LMTPHSVGKLGVVSECRSNQGPPLRRQRTLDEAVIGSIPPSPRPTERPHPQWWCRRSGARDRSTSGHPRVPRCHNESATAFIIMFKNRWAQRQRATSQADLPTGSQQRWSALPHDDHNPPTPHFGPQCPLAERAYRRYNALVEKGRFGVV
jgi:hypothetical protein